MQQGGSAAHQDSDEPSALPDDLAPEGFEQVETAFRGRLKTFRLRSAAPVQQTIPEFLRSVVIGLVSLMHHVLQHVTTFKVNLWLDCEFINVHDDTCHRTFKTKNIPIHKTSDIEELCQGMFEKLNEEYETCAMKGSGWSFVRVTDMEIRINTCGPLTGASFIPTPPEIANKRCIINVHNDDDDRCFEYAILSRFLINPNRPQPADCTPDVRARANLDFTGLTFPVSLSDIGIFERKNGVSVNVYGLDTTRNRRTGSLQTVVFPLRVCKREEPYPKHFDLLYLTDEETTHFTYITNFERLVHSQIRRRKGRIYVCRRCFAHFDERPDRTGLGGARRLAEHRSYCYENAPLRTDLAAKKKLKFERYERTQRVRFTIYADFECALVPFEEPLDPPPTLMAAAGDPATDRGATNNRQRPGAGLDSANVRTRVVHKPYAYAYYVLDDHRRGQDENDVSGNTFSELRLYRGPDAAHHFMSSIKEDVRHIGDLLYGRRRLQPQLTAGEEAAFQAASHCFICQGPFTADNNNNKVRDHQHSPPYRFRGAAHQNCNLQFKEQDVVNCYLHNLSNYDAHFIVRELGIDSGDVSVLANTEEKFITFTKRFPFQGAGRHNRLGVRFIDTYRFMSRSLAHLVKLLPENRLIRTRAHNPDPEQFALVRRKGVFPYEYVTSLRVLDELVLPPPAAFKNTLKQEDITAEDYSHAQKVWQVFRCTSLGDYSDLYLKTDVLLLADVFESFRDDCIKHYGLDPAHWVTLPSYAWEVMMFKTKVVLDTLQDVDMYTFFERGIRGGIVQCVTRHAVANNKYIRGYSRDSRVASTSVASLDVGIEERADDGYIMYFDANNLYGWAMSQPLPYGDFEWLSRKEMDALNIGSIGADSDVGYVLEVDLEYPENRDLQDRHRDLPFCPEVRRPPAGQLPYPPDIVRNFNIGSTPKLMTTLLDKTHYVIHYRYLQQALENGLRVRQIHKVLRYKQSSWMKPYVAMNTELRRLATNKFEVELFKLMVNAVYGMSLQNVRKHIDIKFATNYRQYLKLVSKPNFLDRTIYSENLVMMHMSKVNVVLDRPVYAGMCILDHSKWWMYRFHYKMLDRYGLDNIRLLYQDTDSLMYWIHTLDAYKDILENMEEFDTSNYPQDHPCYNPRNARVLGKFKDETAGVAIKEFIGLLSKLYCILRCGDTEEDDDGPPPIKRAKGVNKAVVTHCLTVQDYRRCLFQHTVKHTANDRFQSRHHIVYTVEVAKRSLAPYDDKRYVIPEDGGVNTLPWGHYAIPNHPHVPDLTHHLQSSQPSTST